MRQGNLPSNTRFFNACLSKSVFFDTNTSLFDIILQMNWLIGGYVLKSSLGSTPKGLLFLSAWVCQAGRSFVRLCVRRVKAVRWWFWRLHDTQCTRTVHQKAIASSETRPDARKGVARARPFSAKTACSRITAPPTLRTVFCQLVIKHCFYWQ